MLFETALPGKVASIGIPLIQFGGDLIGLAILFLILAVVAALLGARGIAGLSMDIAKWLIIIFVLLAIVSLFI